MENWLSLITTLPTENATLRQRAWRALKASGAAVLRDGVYLMPARPSCLDTLGKLAHEVREGGGSAHLLTLRSEEDEDFIPLFDRSAEFSALRAEIRQLRQTLTPDTLPQVQRHTRKLRKAHMALAEIDFFPAEPQQLCETTLRELELACARALSPDEPQPQGGDIPRLLLADYQGRVWATRQRPWVDRLASAWLIRRFIDPHATLLWLASPADCPPDALGYDFDGATFSHVGKQVTFEVLLSSFGLQQPALLRLAAVVHSLDAGGAMPPEAPGLEGILAGLRAQLTDDDALLAAASAVLDGLLTHFSQDTPAA
ncbi:chromate resistance protein ChrB domain-containing protein [Leeia aquatica]|uniref:Chromate resistance protein n=1 Tax=Leeia aquatica TaxID=2725557 RepID=A0A847S967_9NEIS|nr:chromate resistance protein ChrB domain-containing protein [Leeia aquatica]NLR74136.1 chromate resistance protein [Leeia aquatica]